MHRLSNEALRIFVYDFLLETGRPPTLADISRRFDVPEERARDTMRSLRAGKTLLAHPDTGEVWMAGPFAGEPTPYRVTGPRVAWFANCAWDMLGIPVVAGESVDIEAECGDCGEPIRLHVDTHSGPEADADALVHILVPARQWYDDIGYT